MKKRVQIVAVALVVTAAGLITWQVFRQREPVYQGKPLSAWLLAYNLNELFSRNTASHAASWQSADQAVRVMGTNGIPTLLRLLSKKDSTLKLNLIALAQKQHWVVIRHVPARDWNIRAQMALGQLVRSGHDTDSALPALVDIYERNISPESRRCALSVIGNIGLPAPKIVPSLLAQTTNQDLGIRLLAVGTLARMHCEPETVVPVLIKAMHDPDFSIQVNAVIGLGAFGPQAKMAVPALLESLKDQNFYVPDERIASTLRSIDPEAARKAGLK